jgi:CRISPR-associated protein Csb2
MRVILEQHFLLGRFHATPWRVNPFDDPYGEWPPSPWRLARSVVARMYQLARETGSWPERGDDLCRALCASVYSFYLPPLARRCPPVRFYQPTGFAWQPQSRTKKVRGRDVQIPGMRGYDRSLVQDNSWALPQDEAVLWFLDGNGWDPALLDLLDRCLERIVYFGRAESITTIRRADDPRSLPEPNSRLREQPVEGARVPILCPLPVATREHLETMTGRVRDRLLPPGARWMYATRPRPEPLREPRRQTPTQPPVHVIQFVLGVVVQPERRAIVHLTNRFRGRAIRGLVEGLTGGAVSEWSRAPSDVRQRASALAGKDAAGTPFEGHRHAHYLLWSDEGRHYTRLVVWRPEPFDAEEIEALLRAAERPIGWGAQGPQPETWRVRLVPLPLDTAPPPGLDGRLAREWRSVTPFVPPRHLYRRNGLVRPREAVENQVAAELVVRGLNVRFELLEEGDAWVAVHQPRRWRVKRTPWGDRRGYFLRLRFQEPVAGPLILGHSATFGLGLFKPA